MNEHSQRLTEASALLAAVLDRLGLIRLYLDSVRAGRCAQAAVESQDLVRRALGHLRAARLTAGAAAPQQLGLFEPPPTTGVKDHDR